MTLDQYVQKIQTEKSAAILHLEKAQSHREEVIEKFSTLKLGDRVTIPSNAYSHAGKLGEIVRIRFEEEGIWKNEFIYSANVLKKDGTNGANVANWRVKA